MTFDKTQPTDTTKIRRLGEVIRPNWVAIEEGDSSFKPYAVNYQNRTPLGVSNDPSTISGSFILYTKEDGAGNPELFGKDSAGNIIQITKGGSIGSSSSNLDINSISFDGGTFTNNQNAMCTAWSYVVVSGSSISAQTNYGMSWTRVSAGTYKATFSASQVLNSNYVVTGTAVSGAAAVSPSIISVKSTATRDTSEFTIQIQRLDSTKVDVSFHIAIFGGR